MPVLGPALPAALNCTQPCLHCCRPCLPMSGLIHAYTQLHLCPSLSMPAPGCGHALLLLCGCTFALPHPPRTHLGACSVSGAQSCCCKDGGSRLQCLALAWQHLQCVAKILKLHGSRHCCTANTAVQPSSTCRSNIRATVRRTHLQADAWAAQTMAGQSCRFVPARACSSRPQQCQVKHGPGMIQEGVRVEFVTEYIVKIHDHIATTRSS
jgi:hypothetical protein